MRIVTGLDFSRSSTALLKRSLTHASQRGCPLVVVHAIPQDGLGRFLFSNPDKAKNEVVASASEKLEEMLSKTDTGDVDVISRVETGNPSKIICDELSPDGEDLLVLSAHDSGRQRLGPTAARCIRRARADILLVRDWHDSQYNKIVVCTDFSSESARALEEALEIAEIEGSKSLEIIHVIYPPGKDLYGPVIDDFSGGGTAYREHVHGEVERRFDDFCAPYIDRLKKVSYSRSVLESDSPGHRITVHVRAVEADLVVLGTTGAGSFFGLLLGSNAERVLHDAPCSVLAVKLPEKA